MVKWQVKILWLLIVGLLVFPSVGWADAAAQLTLEQALERAVQQGADMHQAEINSARAQENLKLTKNNLGIGIVTSKGLQENIDILDNAIADRQKEVAMLSEKIENWEQELELGSYPNEEEQEVKANISGAKGQIAILELEIYDIRGVKVPILLNQIEVKAREDQVKPSLDPALAARDAAGDNLQLQAEIIPYRVTDVYLSLLSLQRQINYQQKIIAQLELNLHYEKIRFELGLSSRQNGQQREESLRQALEGERNLQANEKNLMQSLRRLVGLAENQPVELVQPELSFIDNQAPEEYQLPDFQNSIKISRASENLQKKNEDLADLNSQWEKEKYRIAQLNVVEAELQLEQATAALNNNFKNKYDNFKLAEQALQDANQKLGQATEAAALARLQYYLGVITRMDLEQRQLSRLEAEMAFEAARQKKYLAWQAYQLAKKGIEI